VILNGVGVLFKISGEQTSGLFRSVKQPIGSGRFVQLHIHTREDEFSYVLEGAIGARIGDESLMFRLGELRLEAVRIKAFLTFLSMNSRLRLESCNTCMSMPDASILGSLAFP
jgi:hypothetical protein